MNNPLAIAVQELLDELNESTGADGWITEALCRVESVKVALAKYQTHVLVPRTLADSQIYSIRLDTRD